MGPFRPSRLPPDVAAHVGKGGRVLAAAPLTDGDWAVATTTTLSVVARDGERWRRPWHEVDRGSWEETGAVTVRWVDGSQTHLTVSGAGSRAFAEVFRERVQSSVVHVEDLRLRGGVIVRAVIRRAGDGTLLSQVIADGAVSPSEETDQAIRALEARVRQAVGLPG